VYLNQSLASSKAPSKSRSTFVDPTFAANERGKRFTMRFVFGTVTHHARPLRSCSLVDFLTISGAQNDRGKRFVDIWQVKMLQPQRLSSPVDGSTFNRPPGHEIKRVGLEAGPLSQWLYSVLAEAVSA
jgi:hypothetical protein